MSIGLIIRTARHLTFKQWGWRFYCRGQFLLMEKWPQVAHRHYLKAAQKMPNPLPESPRLASAAKHVIQLQAAVHGDFFEDIAKGKFTLLNRTVDFGSLSQVKWRQDLGEGNNRLWRMNLAYMGYLVPIFKSNVRAGLEIAHSLLTSMHIQNPWSERGVFRDVWHPYSVSHRIINLLTCLSLTAASGIDMEQADTSHVINLMVEEIKLGAAFVSANLERDLQYNHLFKNYVSLIMLASASNVDKLSPRTAKPLVRLIHQQFLPDGGPAERCPMYHVLALLDLRILRDSGVLPPTVSQLVSRISVEAEQAVHAMTHPDGEIALFNDSWMGEAPMPANILERSANSLNGRVKNELPDTGYVRMASGKDSVVFDFGPCGPDDNPGHAHADFLSLELSVQGERLIVDPGVPTYSAGKAREWSRSAHSHNGPTVGQLEPIEFWGSFRVGRRGYAYKLPCDHADQNSLTFTAWHDGYKHAGVIVGRAVRLVPGKGLLIVDSWAGNQELPAFTHFIIGKDWSAVSQTQFQHQNNTAIPQVSFKCIECSFLGPVPTQYYERFGVAENGTRISLIPQRSRKIGIAGCWISWSTDTFDWRAEWEHLSQNFLMSFLSLPSVRHYQV
jgi:uncharacterized heparinase superfamily protein